MVLICQAEDTRLKGDDRDTLGMIKLTAEDLRRILTHGQQFPFLTAREREEGGSDLWETMMWETCDIEVWVTTRDLVFPVTKGRDTVRSVRDAVEGRQTNFIISPEIMSFNRQILGEWNSGNEPSECMRILRDMVDQWHQTEDPSGAWTHDRVLFRHADRSRGHVVRGARPLLTYSDGC
jgi:hypothetical protein